MEFLECHNPLVIHDCSVYLEFDLFALASFVGIDDFTDCSDDKLCAQSIFLLEVVINNPLKAELGKAFLSECDFRDVVASRVESFHRCLQCFELHFVGAQLDFESRFHLSSEHNSHYGLECQSPIFNYFYAAIPPTAKDVRRLTPWASLRKFCVNWITYFNIVGVLAVLSIILGVVSHVRHQHEQARRRKLEQEARRLRERVYLRDR